MTASELEALARPLLDDAGFEFVECNVSRLQRSQIFRVYIDHEDGVAVEACARMSRVISSELDANPLLRGAYRIEVSSPGMNRAIRTPQHFQRFRGERVQIEFVDRDESGARHLTGTIGQVDDATVWIEPEGGDAVAVAFDRIEAARLRLDPWKGKRAGRSQGAPKQRREKRTGGHGAGGHRG